MRRTLIGTVVSDRNDKTRRVDVSRVYQHSKYKKIVRGRTICYVHDENNESKVGDSVEIVESRPRSATKRWELVRIVAAAGDVESQLTREEIAAAKAGAAETAATELE
jgi:small subunit ribosomal protein S17